MSRFRCLGGCAQQRFQSHRGEQSSLLWTGFGSQSHSPQISSVSGHLQQRGLWPSASRQLTKLLLYAPELTGNTFELQQMEKLLKLSVADFKTHARTLSSPDELSVYLVRQLMRQLAPSLLWVTMHDIDIAHAGAYSLYIEGIQRTDRLCAELWQAIQSEPEYAGKTTLFILPDFGRDADEDAGGNGFQHHRTGDAGSRTTWMMALGPGIREGVVFDRPLDSTDLDSHDRLDDGLFRCAGPWQTDHGVAVRLCFPRISNPSNSGGYPPEARKLALDYLGTFRQLPIGFLPNLLREVIEYDFRFPAERRSLERELANLRSLSAEDIRDWFRSFAAIQVSSKLERLDWVNSPAQFVEQLSAHLWTTHQMDAFRNAALAYADRLRAAVPPEPPPLPRLGIGSSARVCRLPQNLYFENCARMGCTSARSTRKMAFPICSRPSPPAPKRIHLHTLTGMWRAARRCLTIQQLRAFLTTRWLPFALPSWQRFKRKPRREGWGRKRCVR